MIADSRVSSVFPAVLAEAFNRWSERAQTKEISRQWRRLLASPGVGLFTSGS